MKVTRTHEMVGKMAKVDALKNIPFAVSYHMMFGKWPRGEHVYDAAPLGGKVSLEAVLKNK